MRQIWIIAFILSAAIGAYAGITSHSSTVTTRHTVHTGETLWEIAGNTVQDDEDIRQAVCEIIEDNGLDWNGALKPGTTLTIHTRRTK